MTMPTEFTDLDGREIDIVIIGGGITGAGAAWDAALRGADVALFEKRDFASGTSSRSSKLIHGGLRYLEQGDLKLIYEAVNERRRLRKLARHLVRPLGFHFVRFKDQKPSLGLVNIGLWIYEALTAFRVDKMHQRLGPVKTLAEVPKLRRDGLIGSLFYYDAMAQDARVALEAIIGARQAGAFVANYTPVTGVERAGDKWKVTAIRKRDGQQITVTATAVIAAVGPWGNDALKPFFPDLEHNVRPSKGIHIVLNPQKLPIRHAVATTHPRDGRATFTLPARGYVYHGTTDTDYEGDIDEPGVTLDDVEYLLENVQYHFPEAGITMDDITATWSGLRPLVSQDKASAYNVSREHQVGQVQSGFFTIEGGKLTTFRVMAADVVDAALSVVEKSDRSPVLEDCRTAKEPLPGARGIYNEQDLADLTARVQAYLACDSDIASHLVFTYGMRVMEMLSLLEAYPERILPDLPYTWGEMRFILANEHVHEIEDVFLRRTEIYYQDPENGLSVLDELASLAAQVLGLDEGWVTRSSDQYRQRVDDGMAFRKSAGA